MTLESLLVHSVTILTPAYVTDRYGNQTKDFDNATPTIVRGWMSQRDRTEDHTQREAQVSEWVLFLGPDEEISAADRVEWEGISFEVNGPTKPAWSPRGVHHLEVALRVVNG